MSEMTNLPLRTFIYDDIPKSDAFRYLVLHPGGGKEPLGCSLLTSFINEAPPYEAISYVWGTETLDRPITCNNKAFLITQNLSKVLHRLRLPDTPRTLWADSICINQQDLEEKGRQVGVMTDIYKNAACVLICVGGDHEGHGPRVQSLLEEVTKMIRDEVDARPNLSWDSFPYYSQNNTPFVDDARWDSIRTLLKQQWFDRGWVVREAALAQQGRVVWGQSEFDWAQLMLTLLWLDQRARAVIKNGNMPELARIHLEAYVDRHIAEPHVQCLQFSWWYKSSLLDYLSSGRILSMTDPRDRLYAFLDIALEDDLSFKVVPEYGDTHLAVYHNFATQYICTTKDLTILDFVVHNTQTLRSDIPTWVPSWHCRNSGPAGIPKGNNMTSCVGHIPEPTLVDDDLLKLRGVILGPVLFATQVFDELATAIEPLARVWREIQAWISGGPYQGRDPLQAFLSTLTVATIQGSNSKWAQEEEKFFNDLLEASDALSERTPYDSDTRVCHVRSWIQECANGRKLVFVKRGYMGLCPALTQEGDLCAIMFGCTSPCILRKTSQQNHFQYLGPCFVTGRQRSLRVDGGTCYGDILGSEQSKDWLDWDVEEQDIYLC